MIKNWPRVEPCAWERMALRLGRASGGLRAQFKAAEEDLLRPSKWHEEFVQPRGVTVTPFKTIFVDLFFGEELSGLRAGLRSIHASLGAGGSARDPGETLDRLVARGMPGAWASLFSFKLPGSGEAVTVHVHTLSPTLGCVALEATPSDSRVAQFKTVLSQAPPRDRSLWRLRARESGAAGWFLEAPGPLGVRKRQIEKVFLPLNQAVVEVARDHIGSGMSLGGPLPSFETFLLETHDLSRPITDGDMETFWQSLEMPQRAGAHYRDEAVTTYAPLWSREEDLYFRCRVTVDGASVEKRDATEGSKEEAAAVRLSMSAGWYELHVLWAILHALDRLRRELDRLESAAARSHPRDLARRLSRAFLHHGRLAAALFDDAGDLVLPHAGAAPSRSTPREDWIREAGHGFRESRRRLAALRDVLVVSR